MDPARAMSEPEQWLERGVWDRHCHPQAYGALILQGGYIEAGDNGRWLAEAGDLVVHRAYDAHANSVEQPGTVVCNFALPANHNLPTMCQLRDPDGLVVALRKGQECLTDLLEPSSIRSPSMFDWQDMLARDLRCQPVAIGDWAEAQGLSAETVSRGFRRAYGISPSRYRLKQQCLYALDLLRDNTESLSTIAVVCGFSDQAHMSRTVFRLTGLSPKRLRVKFVQDRGLATR